MKRRTLTLVVGLAAAAALGGAGEARAADECRGLQVCLPVPGPWVAIPAPAGGGVPTVSWEMRCPLRGYIVAGIDARVSDRAIDVSIRGENGAPVSPGVTTGRAVLFTAVYTGPARKPNSKLRRSFTRQRTRIPRRRKTKCESRRAPRRRT